MATVTVIRLAIGGATTALWRAVIRSGCGAVRVGRRVAARRRSSFCGNTTLWGGRHGNLTLLLGCLLGDEFEFSLFLFLLWSVNIRTCGHHSGGIITIIIKNREFSMNRMKEWNFMEYILIMYTLFTQFHHLVY